MSWTFADIDRLTDPHCSKCGGWVYLGQSVVIDSVNGREHEDCTDAAEWVARKRAAAQVDP